jgi:hypothetical protein
VSAIYSEPLYAWSRDRVPMSVRWTPAAVNGLYSLGVQNPRYEDEIWTRMTLSSPRGSGNVLATWDHLTGGYEL